MANNYKYEIEINKGKEKRITLCNNVTVAKRFCLMNKDARSYVTNLETGELLFLNAPAN